MNANQQFPSGSADQLMTTRLLELGMCSSNRPVDDLIHRLELADGPGWFQSALRSEAIRPLGGGTESVSLATIRQVKEVCKVKLAAPSSEAARLEGLLGYFLSLAAARVWHRERISDRPEAQVRSVLADLSTVTPVPWQSVLAHASLPSQ